MHTYWIIIGARIWRSEYFWESEKARALHSGFGRPGLHGYGRCAKLFSKWNGWVGTSHPLLVEWRAFYWSEPLQAQNEGILTIATSNHPERIDDAILNRPSRFDVKYDYALPDAELRSAFAMKWIRKVGGLGAVAAGGRGISFHTTSANLAKQVATKTEGWSFAFLKEL